jgi:hypothetical protein
MNVVITSIFEKEIRYWMPQLSTMSSSIMDFLLNADSELYDPH